MLVHGLALSDYRIYHYIQRIIAPKGDHTMSVESIVQAKIDENIRVEVTAALAAMGLTVSDAFRLMMIRIANDRALPFEPLIPNEETIDAMRSAQQGELTFAGSPENLLASLNDAED